MYKVIFNKTDVVSTFSKVEEAISFALSFHMASNVSHLIEVEKHDSNSDHVDVVLLLFTDDYNDPIQ